ncbi:MAG: hypothetical protein ABIG03_06920 [Candidatus Eisenbacteria bacterium]
MRTFVIVLMVLAVAAGALAGQNPNIRAFVSFDASCDTGPYVHEVSLTSGILNSYLILDCFSVSGGMRQVSLTWTTTWFGIPLAPTYYLPGAQAIGGPDDQAVGWVISGNECVYPNECGIVVVLLQPYFVVGPGTITLSPNPIDGTLVTDCNFAADYYCIAANGGIGMTPPPGDQDCDCNYFIQTDVGCEPQGSGNPTHPPTYWYRACPDYAEYMHGFHVQVFDPDFENYTNWVDPYGWTHCDSIVRVGDEYWVAWRETLDFHTPEFGYTWFRFDNPNLATWGHWTQTAGAQGHNCDPYTGTSHSSWDFPDRPDGYGYRVHVPESGVPVQETSWGTIKAMHR